MDYGSSAHQSTILILPGSTHRPRNPPSSMVRSAVGLLSWCGVSPLVKWGCGPFVDEGDGRANRHASLFDEPSAEFEGDRLMTCAHGLGGPCYALRLLRLGSSRLVISGGVTKSNRCGAYGNSPRLAPSGSQGQSPACEPTSASGWAI